MPVRKKATTRKKTTTTRKKTTAAQKKAPAHKAAAKKATTRKPKTALKRAAVKKTTVKKKAAKRTTAKKTSAKTSAKASLNITSALTKSQLYATIGEQCDLTKKNIESVFESLNNIIEQHVKKNGPQLFTLPGLLKIKVVRKPATKSRKGINPFTGEPTVFKAKPARNVVKIQSLKKLKEMAQ